IDHAPAGCGHLSRGRLRSGGVDSYESGQNPLSPSQRLVTGTDERLFRSVRRRCCRLEKHFRSSRKCWRSRILPDRTGRQPVYGTRYCAALLAVLPAHPSSVMPMCWEASLLTCTIGTAGKSLLPKSVTYVASTLCYLSVRAGPEKSGAESGS